MKDEKVIRSINPELPSIFIEKLIKSFAAHAEYHNEPRTRAPTKEMDK